MATLHIRNVPDELYRELKEEAESSGRSLTQEVIQVLKQGLNSSPCFLADLLRDMAKDNSSIAAPTVEELIREDRRR